MDEFFQKLRKIQKKERNESGLARVGDDFYKRVHRYLEELMDTVGHDPFAKEQYLLRDTQRIATEICERREHKINDSAVMNIQRSYHLFKGKPQFDLQDTTPLNLTPEEEQLYFSLIDTLKTYRDKLIPSLESFDKENSVPPIEQVPSSSRSGIEDSPRDEGLNILDHIRASQNSKSQDSDKTNSNFQESTEEFTEGSGASLPNKTTDSEDLSSEIQSARVKSSPESIKKTDSKPSPSKYEGFPDLDGSIDLDQDISSNPEYLEEQDNQNSLKSSGSKHQSKKLNMDLKTMVVFEELPSIVGVDEKVYGPFYPQDVITIPEANAQIFIKARKGRLIRT